MKQGATLVEVLTIVAIIAIIGGVSVGYIRTTAPGSILNSQGRAIATDLRYAAELAVSTQINHTVRFDATLNQYAIFVLENPERLIKQTTLHSDLSFASITLLQNAAEFNALGAVVALGVVTIQHRNGAISIIDVRPSGYVQIR